MVDLAQLARDARRTAEWSRLRMALRATAIVGAITAVAVAAGGAIGACLCLGVALLVGAVPLRWWSRAGVEAVHLGLVMGSVPLVAALFLPACGVSAPRRDPSAASSWCAWWPGAWPASGSHGSPSDEGGRGAPGCCRLRSRC